MCTSHKSYMRTYIINASKVTEDDGQTWKSLLHFKDRLRHVAKIQDENARHTHRTQKSSFCTHNTTFHSFFIYNLYGAFIGYLPVSKCTDYRWSRWDMTVNSPLRLVFRLTGNYHSHLALPFFHGHSLIRRYYNRCWSSHQVNQQETGWYTPCKVGTKRQW